MSEQVADEFGRASADTWRSSVPTGTIDPRLVVDKALPMWPRLRAWRARHRLRAQQAADHWASSRQPERGLPVAENSAVLGFTRDLMRPRKLLAVQLVALNLVAAVVGMIVPRLLGGLIDHATSGDLVPDMITAIVFGATGVVLLQTVLTFLARRVSVVFSQGLLADAREDVVRSVLRLPLGRVESASSGDLVTRITRDVSAMSDTAKWALPGLVMSLSFVTLTMVALFLNSWLLALPSVGSLVLLYFVTRSYLRKSPSGYVKEGATYSDTNSSTTETVESARTVEALGLQRQRVRIGDRDTDLSGQAERYTMSLRNLMFLFIDLAYQAPLIGVVLLGTWGHSQGWVTLGQITAAAIYIQALVDPMDTLIFTLDRLSVGLASTTRLLGVGAVPPDRTPTDAQPAGSDLIGRDLRFAYREGHDVLHGIDLTLVPGERLAIVGPSGSGKSTLGRLLAGINGPRTGSVTVGGVELLSLREDILRTEVALVTQEHHVFVGTLEDNIILARDRHGDEHQRREWVWAALRGVEADEWVERLPDGLQTKVGAGNHPLTPAQAQQVALARLIVADPDTLVLDEATSLIDPRTARHLEGSMVALMTGRTVVAIAHRLHTAHDADRIAVVIDGRIAELGSHDELLAAGGEYAALWQAWTS